MIKVSGLLIFRVIFRWHELGGAGECRVGSSLLRGSKAFPIHQHDFPEVFWILEGAGDHLINGKRIPLEPGLLVLIRPEDRHGFVSDNRGVWVRNVAVRPEIVQEIRQRYFRFDDGFWGGNDSACPIHHRLSHGRLQEIERLFKELCSGSADLLGTERFLLNVIHIVQQSDRTYAEEANLPDWLALAIRRWNSRAEHLTEGTAALVRLTGRSPEHLSRVMRRYTGRNPTDWVNEARMRHASKELEATNRKILDIALECGFNSLGHFYLVFKKACGCSPRAYRMRFLPRPL